jgi:hypothetical protein
VISSPALRWLLASLVVVVFPACAWYPYHWRSMRELNHAQRSASGALVLREPGIARSVGAPSWLPRAQRAQRFDLVLRARPSRAEQTGPAKVFTLSSGRGEWNLSLGQQGDSLRLRLRRNPWNENALPELAVPGVFRAGEWVTLQASVGGGLFSLAVDGRDAVRFAIPPSALAAWEDTYAVALGNELDGDRPWLGEITRAEVVIDEQRVNLLAPGNLTLPKMLRRYNTPPKLVPLRGLELRDGVVNLLGFIPLGWALSFAVGRPLKLALAAFAGFGVSLVLETAQLWLPTRFPSIDDVVLNTLGCVLGLWLAQVVADVSKRGGLVKSQMR